MKLETDSAEYDILERAVLNVKDKDGIIIEFGTRMGGSMQIIIDAAGYGVFISVDCYGNIPYYDGLKELPTRYDYTNNMKNIAYAGLFEYVKDKAVNLIPMNLEDTEFFKRYADGVPVYNITKRLINNYRLGFLDAGHRVEDMKVEIEFLAPRMDYGSMLVIDDVDFYDVNAVIAIMKLNHFEVFEQGSKKASFIKTLPSSKKPL